MIFKKAISITIILSFLCGDCVNAIPQSAGCRMLAPKSDFFGLEHMLELGARELLNRYHTGGQITVVDKEAVIEDLNRILKNRDGYLLHYLRKIIRAIRAIKEDKLIRFVGVVEGKKFEVIPRQHDVTETKILWRAAESGKDGKRVNAGSCVEQKTDDTAGEKSDGGLIGKWQPLGEIKFFQGYTGVQEGTIQFKAVSIDDPKKKVINIKIRAQRAPPGVFEGYKRTGIKIIDTAIASFLDGITERERFLIMPNEYGIDGIGTKNLLAILDVFAETKSGDNNEKDVSGIALFHEIAHGAVSAGLLSLDPILYEIGRADNPNISDASAYRKNGEELLYTYISENEKEYRKNQAFVTHYALRLLQRLLWDKQDKDLTRLIQQEQIDFYLTHLRGRTGLLNRLLKPISYVSTFILGHSYLNVFPVRYDNLPRNIDVEGIDKFAILRIFLHFLSRGYIIQKQIVKKYRFMANFDVVRVYGAWDIKRQQRVVIRINKPRSKDDMSEFNEIQHLFDKDNEPIIDEHPNIARPIAYGFLGESVGYEVFEFAEGKTLAEWEAEGRTFSVKEAVSIVSQISLALEHIHTSGYIHGDVFLKNIILSDKGIVKMIDFEYPLTVKIKSGKDVQIDIFALKELFLKLLPNDILIVDKNIEVLLRERKNTAVSAKLFLWRMIGKMNRYARANPEGYYHNIAEFRKDLAVFEKLLMLQDKEVNSLGGSGEYEFVQKTGLMGKLYKKTKGMQRYVQVTEDIVLDDTDISIEGRGIYFSFYHKGKILYAKDAAGQYKPARIKFIRSVNTGENKMLALCFGYLSVCIGGSLLPETLKEEIKDYLELVQSNPVSIVEDFPGIYGGVAGGRLFLSKSVFYSLINKMQYEGIPLFHELLEGFFTEHPEHVPPGIHPHTFLRGAGEKLRRYAKTLKTEYENAESFIAHLESTEAIRAIGRKATFSEINLIIYNYQAIKKDAGFAVINNQSLALYGIQDYVFGDEVNRAFTCFLKVQKEFESESAPTYALPSEMKPQSIEESLAQLLKEYNREAVDIFIEKGKISSFFPPEEPGLIEDFRIVFSDTKEINENTVNKYREALKRINILLIERYNLIIISSIPHQYILGRVRGKVETTIDPEIYPEYSQFKRMLFIDVEDMKGFNPAMSGTALLWNTNEAYVLLNSNDVRMAKMGGAELHDLFLWLVTVHEAQHVLDCIFEDKYNKVNQSSMYFQRHEREYTAYLSVLAQLGDVSGEIIRFTIEKYFNRYWLETVKAAFDGNDAVVYEEHIKAFWLLFKNIINRLCDKDDENMLKERYRKVMVIDINEWKNNPEYHMYKQNEAFNLMQDVMNILIKDTAKTVGIARNLLEVFYNKKFGCVPEYIYNRDLFISHKPVQMFFGNLEKLGEFDPDKTESVRIPDKRNCKGDGLIGNWQARVTRYPTKKEMYIEMNLIGMGSNKGKAKNNVKIGARRMTNEEETAVILRIEKEISSAYNKYKNGFNDKERAKHMEGILNYIIKSINKICIIENNQDVLGFADQDIICINEELLNSHVGMVALFHEAGHSYFDSFRDNLDFVLEQSVHQYLRGIGIKERIGRSISDLQAVEKGLQDLLFGELNNELTVEIRRLRDKIRRINKANNTVEEIAEKNIDIINSEVFDDAVGIESIGGNAGNGYCAVNMLIDQYGAIVSIGNPIELEISVIEKLCDAGYEDVCMKVKMFPVAGKNYELLPGRYNRLQNKVLRLMEQMLNERTKNKFKGWQLLKDGEERVAAIPDNAREQKGKKGNAKVLGECISKKEAEIVVNQIKEAEETHKTFSIYPHAERYSDDLEYVMHYLGRGPIRYQKYGKYLERENVYIKIVRKDSGFFDEGNIGFIVEDEQGNKREIYAFSMFNPEDNPDGPVYATIYIPETVLLKAKEHNFLGGFAMVLAHELVEIDSIKARGLAGKILDGDMDADAHKLAEEAEFDFGVMDGISVLGLFLSDETDIEEIRNTAYKAVDKYKGKSLTDYTTMPKGLIKFEVPQFENKRGIILDGKLILNEIGMRECLDELAKIKDSEGRQYCLVWVTVEDEKEKMILEKMKLPVQEIFVKADLNLLIRKMKGKVGAGNVGIGLYHTSRVDEALKKLVNNEKVPVVVPELPKQDEIVSAEKIINGLLSAIVNPPEEWIIVLPAIKMSGELWKKLLEEYRAAVELELYA
jgi:hypothetical protein